MRKTSFTSRSFMASATLLLVLATAPAHALDAPDTAARQAILLDAETGAVLFAKNADEPMGPASMTKMMTIYLVFERLRDGRLQLDTGLPVSEKAWRTGGSKMFVEVGQTVRVEDLIQGIIVQSGNDATIVVAEALAGSETQFAEEMTRKAHEFGMAHTTFKNPDGMPDPEHRTTARDLATLALRTIKDFPEYYHFYAEEVFVFAGITQHNRNPLLAMIGADGLKTGHTEESGYGLTASKKEGDRRLILVVHGLSSEKERAAESRRLMEWGFREFENYRLFDAGDTVETADVWLGAEPTVPLVMQRAAVITMPRPARRDLKVSVVYRGPLPAPLAKGAPAGALRAIWPESPPIEFPLAAGNDVPRLGFFGRMNAAVRYLLWGPSN